MNDRDMIRVEGLGKTFVRHIQGGVALPVFRDLALTVAAGECVVLAGPSGTGKSTLMRAIYANYRPSAGRILVRHSGGVVDMATAEPWQVLAVRRRTMGYVSQFLRVIPRVAALDLVAEPLRHDGVPDAEARAKAMLARLNLPERLWSLPPATFSGGEQQRVNIARSLIRAYPILLLDEPTASLDAANRAVVCELVGEARRNGAAILGIFHDAAVRDAVATRLFDLEPYRQAA
ncbi:MAG: phosphonate C-P lyase system protein PhnL [Thalassobaculales bacterium]